MGASGVVVRGLEKHLYGLVARLLAAGLVPRWFFLGTQANHALAFSNAYLASAFATPLPSPRFEALAGSIPSCALYASLPSLTDFSLSEMR
jgi:hypothetical protein